MMMNFFNLNLSEKHFICPSIQNDSFAGYSNLGCRSLSFMTSNTFFQPLLACKVSFEKSADSLMGIYLFLERGERREKEREGNINVLEIHR